MDTFQEIKKCLGQIVEVGLLLIALGVVVEILFGQTVPFFSKIATNLTALLHNLGEDGFVGLIAAGIILFLFHRLHKEAELPVTHGGDKRQAPPARKSSRGRRK